MLELDTYAVTTSTNKNGALIIKIGKDKIPYNHFDLNKDYFQQAKDYLESKGNYVIGYNHLSKIIIASNIKYDLKPIYKFSELSEEIKLKVIEKFQQADYDYLDATNDYLTELLNKLGFDDVVLNYSVSYSQSDYFRFNGTFQQIDMENLKKEYENVDDVSEIITFIENLDIPAFTRKNNEIEILNDYLLDTEDNIRNINKILKMIDKMIKVVIYNEIDYQSQDSTIIEYIESNGFEFYSNGELAS